MTDPTIVATPWQPRRVNPHIDRPDHDADRLKLYKPKTYLIGNTPMDLYSVGDLAAMLGRSPVTIRKWERLGILPRTPFNLKGQESRGSRRLYTASMVLGIVAIAREENVLELYRGPLRLTDFTAKVKALFDAERAMVQAA